MNVNQILQQGGGLARRGVATTVRTGGRVAGLTYGALLQRTRGSRPAAKPDMDDVTLARKVETTVFRDRPDWRANVDVNVAEGVVFLHGEVRHPDEVRELEAMTRAVPEVRGVENLLHLPKTPAPTRADAPKRQQRTRSSTRRPTPSRRGGGRITDDRTDEIVDAEPSPVEHARTRQGRTPAPLGAVDSGEDDGAPTTQDPERQLPPPD